MQNNRAEDDALLRYVTDDHQSFFRAAICRTHTTDAEFYLLPSKYHLKKIFIIYKKISQIYFPADSTDQLLDINENVTFFENTTLLFENYDEEVELLYNATRPLGTLHIENDRFI